MANAAKNASTGDEAVWHDSENGARLELHPAYYDVPDRVHAVLHLVDADATLEEVTGWSSEHRKAAAEWALSVHYSASDNDDVIVPPRPEFIRHLTGVVIADHPDG